MACAPALINLAVLLGAPHALGAAFSTMPRQTLLAAAVAQLAAWAVMLALGCSSVCGCCAPGDAKAGRGARRRVFLVLGAIGEALVLSLLAASMAYGAAVVLGAPMALAWDDTWAWALWMGVSMTIPAVSTLGRLAQWGPRMDAPGFRGGCACAILAAGVPALALGSWLACLVLPLDDRSPWQRWPVANALLGAAAHVAVSAAVKLAFCGCGMWCGSVGGALCALRTAVPGTVAIRDVSRASPAKTKAAEKRGGSRSPKRSVSRGRKAASEEPAAPAKSKQASAADTPKKRGRKPASASTTAASPADTPTKRAPTRRGASRSASRTPAKAAGRSVSRARGSSRSPRKAAAK